MVEYQSVAKAEAGLPERIPTVYTFKVEQLRLFAYISFWGMCLFAIIVSTFTVTPYLGPCPLNEGDEPTYGMHCSVLMGAFGFNNVSETNYIDENDLLCTCYRIYYDNVLADMSMLTIMLLLLPLNLDLHILGLQSSERVNSNGLSNI